MDQREGPLRAFYDVTFDLSMSLGEGLVGPVDEFLHSGLEWVYELDYHGFVDSFSEEDMPLGDDHEDP